jgi:hypothetical protein
LRRAIARLWEPWIAWAYGASFDRHTEQYIPQAGLELVQATFVVADLVKMITARVPRGLPRSRRSAALSLPRLFKSAAQPAPRRSSRGTSRKCRASPPRPP